MIRQNFMAAAKVAGSALIVATIALAAAGCNNGGGSSGGVQPTAQAPVVAQQIQAQAQSGSTVSDPKVHTLTAVATSPSGNVLTGTWQQTSGSTQVTLTPTVASNSPSFTFTAKFSQPPQAGEYKFRLTVRDSVTGAQTVFNEVTVTIGASPTVAQMINGSSSTSVSGTVPFNVTFDLSGSTDSDGNINGGLIDPGDGSGFINLSASNLTAVHQYVSTGTFTVKLTVYDNENNPSTITVTVNANGTSPPPQPDPLVLNGVFITESSLSSVAPSSSATVFTKTGNQSVGVRGDFSNYDVTQLKAVVTNTVNGADKHVCSVVKNSATELTVLLPSFSAAAVYEVTLFAHASGDVNNVLKNADIGNGPLQLHVIVNPRSTLVMSGEDTTTNFNGSLYGLDIDDLGNSSNSRNIVGGNGHQLKGGLASVNHSNLVYSPGFTGFQVKMFRVDTTDSSATISMNVNNLALENHSPVAVVVTRDGRPLLLTQEVGQTYHVWLLKADLSGIDRHVDLDNTGQGTLPAGTKIAGFYTLRMQESGQAVKDYAVIVAGGTTRAVFMVPLEGSLYYRIDVDATTGFSPQASCLTLDPPTGGFRIDMAGVAPSGTGTSYRTLVLQTGKALALGGMLTRGTSTNDVSGVFTFWQAANNRHLIWVGRSNEAAYDSRDNSDSLNLVHSGTVQVDRRIEQMLPAPGLNGFIIGYKGLAPTGVAGVQLQPFDGSAVTRVELQTLEYNNIAVGLQCFAIDTRAPLTAARFYHAPSATTSFPQTLPTRTDNGTRMSGIATP